MLQVFNFLSQFSSHHSLLSFFSPNLPSPFSSLCLPIFLFPVLQRQVLAWVLVMGLFTYTKATIGWILRNEPDNRKLLIFFGAATQFGSLVGACIMFPLVNVYYLFTPYYESPCDGYMACPS